MPLLRFKNLTFVKRRSGARDVQASVDTRQNFCTMVFLLVNWLASLIVLKRNFISVICDGNRKAHLRERLTAILEATSHTVTSRYEPCSTSAHVIFPLHQEKKKAYNTARRFVSQKYEAERLAQLRRNSAKGCTPKPDLLKTTRRVKTHGGRHGNVIECTRSIAPHKGGKEQEERLRRRDQSTPKLHKHLYPPTSLRTSARRRPVSLKGKTRHNHVYTGFSAG